MTGLGWIVRVRLGCDGGRGRCLTPRVIRSLIEEVKAHLPLREVLKLGVRCTEVPVAGGALGVAECLSFCAGLPFIS